MSTDLPVILLTLIIGFSAIIYFINKKSTSNNRSDETLTKWLSSMQNTLDTRLDNASQLMGQIRQDAGKFAELSLSMKNLQDYLKSPKLRGNIGEQVLKDLIGQMFPKNSFFLQYGFKSGDKVDAAIKTEAGILPIDSKFPSENFQKLMAAENEEAREAARKDFVRDVKKHILDISKKYILPEEGTMDFALMYIPSEPVYYEVVNDMELTEYARRERVYPVSPNTLYANLQVILLSFQGKDIEKKSHQLFALLRGIQKDYSKLSETLATLNKHITNSYNQMNNVQNEFLQLGQKLSSSQNLEEGEEIKKLS
ncbi:MAG: DNA recombination protein RmuC [Patescibacteria group bacterium]|nr:DNA recombination protein RmuC [Patescibacteria group bacterium]